MVRVRGGGVEVEVILLDVLAVVPLGAGQAEEALLEDRVAAVPEGRGEDDELVAVAPAGDPVLAPAIRLAPGEVVGQVVPGVAVVAVVLADRGPGAVADVRPPPPPAGRAVVDLGESLVLLGVRNRPRRRRHGRSRSLDGRDGGLEGAALGERQTQSGSVAWSQLVRRIDGHPRRESRTQSGRRSPVRQTQSGRRSPVRQTQSGQDRSFPDKPNFGVSRPSESSWSSSAVRRLLSRTGAAVDTLLGKNLADRLPVNVRGHSGPRRSGGLGG